MMLITDEIRKVSELANGGDSRIGRNRSYVQFIEKMIKYIALAITLFVVSCTSNDNTVKPTIKPLIEAVYASGYVVSKDEYQVFSQAEGYIADKLIEDGDAVKKGDPLFIIESDQQSLRYQLAKKNYDQAVQNYKNDSPVLRELKAASESARTKMQFDSTNYARYSNLLKQNATSRAEFDRVKLAYENSRNEYLLQNSRYEKIKNQLYLEVENAKSQLQISSVESGRYIVRSQVDGKVFKTIKEKGELVRRTEVVAVVGRDDAFYLQLNVDELDVHRVKTGQNVVVKIDAYPNKVFHATVEKIYPMINQQQQSLRVDAALKDTLPAAFSGLAVEANIIIRQKQNALVIPKTALVAGDTVLIETEDGSKKVRIKRGIETLEEVEILEGIDSAQKLIVKHN